MVPLYFFFQILCPYLITFEILAKSTRKNQKNKKVLESISENPFKGIGKPEPLRLDLAGKWSRRIDLEHRIIYEIMPEMTSVYILAMRYHSDK